MGFIYRERWPSGNSLEGEEITADSIRKPVSLVKTVSLDEKQLNIDTVICGHDPRNITYIPSRFSAEGGDRQRNILWICFQILIDLVGFHKTTDVI